MGVEISRTATKPKHVVIVNQANAPGLLGGTIDSSVLYLIDGVVDCLGFSIEVPATGIFLAGHNLDLSSLHCEDAGHTLFTSPVGGSGGVFARDLNFDVHGVGSQVFDLVDATGFNAVELYRINFSDCSSLGTLSGYRQALEVGTGRFGGKPELTLSGAWSGGYRVTESIVRGLTDGAYTLFKAGAGFTMASRFLADINCDLPASASLLDFASANFTNPSTLQLSGAIVSRSGAFDATDSNITPNITKADIASKWNDNVGIGNTFEGGNLAVSSEVLTTIATSGVFVTLAATWTAERLEHFDVPAGGAVAPPWGQSTRIQDHDQFCN